MAEAWTNRLLGDRFVAYSAGVNPQAIDPRAMKAMAEAGVDISGKRAKDIDSLGELAFEYVVTLCNHARESCPFFPARIRLMHRGFDDPPVLAAGDGDEEEAMAPYRRVRNEIRAFVEGLPTILQNRRHP